MMRGVPAHRQQIEPNATDDHTTGRSVELEMAPTEETDKDEISALGFASNAQAQDGSAPVFTLADESDGRYVLVVSLPEISGIAEIVLDISSHAVALEVPLRPRLVVP